MLESKRMQHTEMARGTARFMHIAVNPITQAELLDFFGTTIKSKSQAVIGAHNMHSVHLVQHNAAIRAFYEICDLAYIDGMPLVWAARALGLPVAKHQRVAFLDWHDEFFRTAVLRNWRIFYLGGTPESSPGFKRILEQRYPGIRAEVHHGYVSDFDIRQLCGRINAFEPHALLVGMGMPIQEKWIVDALPHLKANLVFAGGAMLEYLTGEEKAAPRWMGPFGIEWLYRLVHQPRRLGYRYLIEPLTILPIFLREWLRKKNPFRDTYTKPGEALGYKSND